LRFLFPEVVPTGFEVLKLKGVTKAYAPSPPLFHDVDYLLEKGERVCLTGPNGCGKSTLLGLIARRITPDTGYITYGANVKIGYYDQNLGDIRSEKTVLEEVWRVCPQWTQTQVRGNLGRFLFHGDAVFAPMATLSGGERARVALLKLLLSGANVLLLDEPTNHLDIPAREALEAALRDYTGTMLFVTHDRYFADKLATKHRTLTAHGLVPPEDAVRADAAAREAAVQKAAKPPNAYLQKKLDDAAEKKRRREMQKAEAQITALERELAALQAEMEAPDVVCDAARLTLCAATHAALEEKLECAYAAWEAGQA
jgi:ATP-binding cassette subfamily F protein 3